MKKNEKPQTEKSPNRDEQISPQKIIVAQLREVREMLTEVIKEHIDPPKPLTLADKSVLNTVEAAKFLTEECGHKTSVPTLYAQISQLDKSVQRGCFKRISRIVPHSRVGKYLYFKPDELRQWAAEQVEYSRLKPQELIKASTKK